MMLAWSGTEYKDIRYSGNDWFGEDKPKIQEMTPVANLPYIKDGDFAISQSTACLVYLGEKLGFYCGINDLELIAEIYDLRESMIALVYAFKKACRDKAEFESTVEVQCTKTCPKYYAKFENVLEKNGTKYLLKETPCAADFHLWEMIDQFELLAKNHGHASPVAPFSKLSAYYAAFRAEPKLAAYFDSDAYKLPVNNPAFAYFS